jgi:hypothetical protein
LASQGYGFLFSDREGEAERFGKVDGRFVQRELVDRRPQIEHVALRGALPLEPAVG